VAWFKTAGLTRGLTRRRAIVAEYVEVLRFKMAAPRLHVAENAWQHEGPTQCIY